MPQDRRRHIDEVAGQHPHHRGRRVGAGRKSLGDERAIGYRHFRQEMSGEFLVAVDLVIVVGEVLDEEFGRGAQKRGIARLLVRARDIGEVVGELA